jgi:hypothetical protein
MILRENNMNVISTIPRKAPIGNMAIEFDSKKENYIQIAEGVWFNGDFTIEAWVFAFSFPGGCRIIDFGNGPSQDNVGIALSDSDTGKPQFFTLSGSTRNTLTSTVAIPLQTWVHIACTLKGTTGTIYIDGEPQGTRSDMNVPNNVSRKNNYIARSNWPEDKYADAIFSGIRIWNIALSQKQISDYMNKTFNRAEGQTDIEGVVHSNLLGNWVCCEGYGDTLFNYSDNTNATNGTLACSKTNGALPEWLISSQLKPFVQRYNIQFALRFNAVKKDFISIPSGDRWFHGDFTVEAWVFVFQYTNNSRIIEFKNAAPGDTVALLLSTDKTGKPGLIISNGIQPSVLTATKAIPLCKWTHIACTLQGTTGTIFINGENVCSQTNMTIPLHFGWVYNYIGKDKDGAAEFPYAVYSNIRIWQGVLSVKQLDEYKDQALPDRVELKDVKENVTATLLGNWTLGEGSGNVAFNSADKTGITNGTIKNGTDGDNIYDWVQMWFSEIMPPQQ